MSLAKGAFSPSATLTGRSGTGVPAAIPSARAFDVRGSTP